uniref:Homeobox domain-containing protein n=1 Tax=Caenorhabditis tropicalis TaxID=1561998 RepID=A0A1I7UXP6_9PELO
MFSPIGYDYYFLPNSNNSFSQPIAPNPESILLNLTSSNSSESSSNRNSPQSLEESPFQPNNSDFPSQPGVIPDVQLQQNLNICQSMTYPYFNQPAVQNYFLPMLPTNESPPSKNIETKKSSPGPINEKRKRTTFTREQLDKLESEFEKCEWVGNTRRVELTEKIGVSERVIKVWFKNRRAKNKNQIKTECNDRNGH